MDSGNLENSGDIIASTPVSGEPVAARRVTRPARNQDVPASRRGGITGSASGSIGSDEGSSPGQHQPQPPQQPAYAPPPATHTDSPQGANAAPGGVAGAMSSAATQVSGTVGQAKDQVQETAGQVKDQVQDVAGQVVDQAKEQTMGHLSGQKERAVDGLDSVAEALRQTGEHLREKDQGPVSQYIEGAAGQVERFTNYLRERDMDELIDDSERFARQQPALFLGGAFFVGLLASRFLKSSRNRSSGRSGSQRALPPARYNRGYADYRQGTGAYRDSTGSVGTSFTPSASPSYRAGTEQRSTRVEDIQSYPTSGQPGQYRSSEEYRPGQGSQTAGYSSGMQPGSVRDLGDR